MLDPQSRERDSTNVLRDRLIDAHLRSPGWTLSKARAEELLDWLEGNGCDLALLSHLYREGVAVWCDQLSFARQDMSGSSQGSVEDDVTEPAAAPAPSLQK